ncbi:hypothetical protein [Streptomyces sp. NPDC059957]|uniref:hypothetical protein n=1 Tax=Streptomyces sp. NPDC059957 TaxID=3347016 RepID=UPI003655132B
MSSSRMPAAGTARTKTGRRGATLAAATALFAGLSLTAGAASAQAAGPCDQRSVTNNSSASGFFTKSVNLKTAAAAECGNVAQMSEYDGFYIWCYVYNSYGNQWVYGRVAGTNVKGWTSMDNLNATPDESLNRC